MRVPYQQAEFVLAAGRLEQLPEDEGFEVAIVGRSNAGKSSVINTATGQGKLARTSKTPGRTQQIVVFQLDANHRLMDLPGYGFAKVSESVKHQWGILIRRYLESRQSLKGLVLVMDIRHPFKETDIMLLDWCAQNELPCHVVLNKADKLSRGAASSTFQKAKTQLKVNPLFSCQQFSALKKEGIESLLSTLDDWLALKGEL